MPGMMPWERADDRLPDTADWEHRFQIKSETSTRIYIVAQHKEKRHWGCSCPAWKSRRQCKHLSALQLPNFEKPHEVLG